MTAVVAVHAVTAWWLWSRGEPVTLAIGGVRSEHARALLGGQVYPMVDSQPLRLLTSAWLHVDGLHLILNATALLTLGWVLEPWIGARRLWAWFALGAVGGSMLPHWVGVVRSDGASGGAFALFAALLVLVWRHRATLPERDWSLLGPGFTTLFAVNLVLSVLIPQIDAAAHVGGAMVGAAVAWVPDSVWLRWAERMIIVLFVVGSVVGWSA